MAISRFQGSRTDLAVFSDTNDGSSNFPNPVVVPLVANLLDLVPVRDEEENQVVLKAVNYYDEGMTLFAACHAAAGETRRMDVLSSENDYEDVDVERVPLEPTDDE